MWKFALYFQHNTIIRLFHSLSFHVAYVTCQVRHQYWRREIRFAAVFLATFSYELH